MPITKGHVRAHYFLGDVGADVTRVFSLEKGQKLNILLYEFIDKKASNATPSSPCPNANPLLNMWHLCGRIYYFGWHVH